MSSYVPGFEPSLSGAGAAVPASIIAMPRDRRLSISDEMFLGKELVENAHPKVQMVLMDSHAKLYSDEDVELPSRLRSCSFSRAFPSPMLTPLTGPIDGSSMIPPLGMPPPPGYSNTNPFVLPESAAGYVPGADELAAGLLAGGGAGMGAPRRGRGVISPEPDADDDEEYREPVPASRRRAGRGTKTGTVGGRGGTKKRRTNTSTQGLNRASAAAPKPRKAAGNRRGDGRKDASKAENFLEYMRTTLNPTGERFRQFVHEVNIGLSENNDLGRAMKKFDTRPKYVLRKLAFSILPETSAKREAFARDVLKLGGKVSTQQREAIKTDLITLLLAICDKAPSMARIPEVFNQKQYVSQAYA